MTTLFKLRDIPWHSLYNEEWGADIRLDDNNSLYFKISAPNRFEPKWIFTLNESYEPEFEEGGSSEFFSAKADSAEACKQIAILAFEDYIKKNLDDLFVVAG